MHTLMTHQELLGVHHRSQGHLNTVSGGAGDGTENLQEGLPLSRDERVTKCITTTSCRALGGATETAKDT